MVAGIRTPNLPLGTPTEVLGHSAQGNGALSLCRISVIDLIQLLVQQAGLDPSGVTQIAADVAALKTRARALRQRIAFTTDPLVVDGGALLVPPLYVVDPDNTSSVLTRFAPATGTHWPLGISGDPAVQYRYVLNPTATGNTVPVGIAQGGDSPVAGDPTHIIFATSIGGYVRGEVGVQVISADTGGIAANQFLYGRDVDGLPPRKLFGTTAAVTITDPTLTTNGFTRGWADTTSFRPYVACDLIDAQGGDLAFARALVLSDADNTPPSSPPQVYVFTDSGAVGQGPMRLERQVSARVYSYIWSGTLPAASGIRYLNIGVEPNGSHVYTLTGLQAASGQGTRWISRSDFPSRVSAPGARRRAPQLLADSDPSQIMLGPELWCIAGRPLLLHPVNCWSDRLEGPTFAATFSSVRVDAGNRPYVVTGSEQILIDPSACGDAAYLDVRHRRPDALDLQYEVPLIVRRAPRSLTGSPRVALIGDSLTNRRSAAYLQPRLQSLGLSPSFVGTLQGQDASGNNVGPMGEGREGWKFADYTYQDTRYPPVPVGQESTYLSNSITGRATQNPFIRAATGSDPAANVFNGYVFDYGFYLSRFGLSTPTHIVLALGTNDVILTPTTGLAQVVSSLPVIVSSIRAAAPSAALALAMYGRPRSALGDAVWRQYRAMIAAQMKYARTVNAAAGAAVVNVIPLWQHMSAEIGWAKTGLAQDAGTNLATFQWTDTVHFEDIQRFAVAEQYTAWVGWTIAGLNDNAAADRLPISGGRLTGPLNAAGGLTTTVASFGQTLGNGGASHLRLYDQGTDNASYGLGVSNGALVLNTGGGSVSIRNSGTEVAGIDSAGSLTTTGPVRPARYTVATLPTPGTAGRVAYATNARVSGQAAGAGTGALVTDTGSAWQIAGTNTTAAA